MGFAISWVAVQGVDPKGVLDHFALERTGESEEIPEAPVTCARLPGGWFLVFVNEFNSSLVADHVLRALSQKGTVVSCQLEEHVMVSSACRYAGGSLVWRVEHDAQKSIYDLTIEGDVPPQFAGIRASLTAQQDDAGGAKADVDYIHDAPIALAQAVTSFRHDEDTADTAEPFEVLISAKKSTPATKSRWKLW